MPEASKGFSHRFIPYNGKIADITHADLNKHTLDLAAVLGETRKIIAVIVNAVLMVGAGNIYCYPNEGAFSLRFGDYQAYNQFVVIANGTQRLQYALDTINDDWDVYCFGYVVEA